MGLFSDIGKGVGGVFGGIPGVIIGGKAGGILGGGSKGPGFGRIPKLSEIEKSQTVTDLEKQLKDIPAAVPITGYQAKEITGPLPEYDLARKKLNEEANVAGQAGSEALARRFAAMGGGLNSGAFIKQAEIQNQDIENRRAQGVQDIAVQEATARRGLSEKEADKAFQSGENAKNFNAQQAFQDKVFRFDSSSKLGQLDLAFKSAELNSATEAYNAELNAYTAKHSGGLLGAGGFLGLGLDV